MNIRDSIEKWIDKEMIALLRDAGEICAESGDKAFLVGGAVRDVIIGLPVSDLDVMIQGDVRSVASALSKKVNGAIIPHGSFGTMTLEFGNGHRIDFATARTEYYPSPGALPVVSQSSMEQDLKRRDFSINAMAASLSPDSFGEVIDKFSGASDIEGKCIRVLHDLSFRDDPTRIFRALKFAGRLGFKLEKRTEELLVDALNMGAMNTLSGSRIKKELQLTASESRVSEIVEMLNELNVPSSICEGLKFNDITEIPLDDNNKLNDDYKWKCFLACASYASAVPDAGAFAERISLDKTEKKIVESARGELAKEVEKKLREAEKTSEVADVLRDFPEPVVQCFYSLWDDGLKQKISRYKNTGAVKLEVTGSDLLEIGFSNNAFLGEVLRKLKDMKTDGEIETRNDEIRRAREILEEEGEKQL